MKVDDMVATAEISKNFKEFKSRIVSRGIIKEEYIDFIKSIQADMEILEKVRNCFAHNRAPAGEDLENFNRVKEELLRKIDDFITSLGQEK
ncbi:hypothetical protein ES708_30411 [subsurface metagenome]